MLFWPLVVWGGDCDAAVDAGQRVVTPSIILGELLLCAICIVIAAVT
jgi:hypothetical protein